MSIVRRVIGLAVALSAVLQPVAHLGAQEAPPEIAFEASVDFLKLPAPRLIQDGDRAPSARVPQG